MPTQDPPRPLPDNPNLRHLKDQAKDLMRAGGAESLTQAQFAIARSYGFASWPKLKAHVESLAEIGQLKLAIDTNDVERVKAMMTRHPELHRAPLGYGGNGPLTWVAECRIPWEPPKAERLEMARWMIEHGSDVHQGGDGPLMRAALVGDRVPMMELLLEHGADVNAEWAGRFPIIYAPCETVDPVALDWLLKHGADPNLSGFGGKYSESALDYLIGSYSRTPRLAECIAILAAAETRTRRGTPLVLAVLTGDTQKLASMLDDEPEPVHRRFAEFDFGSSGARRLLLKGGTLLHLAAEYGMLDAVRLLLDRGADVNARAEVDEAGTGGQTPIFHAATQFWDWGFAVLELLLERGADVRVRARVPGHYERPEEFLECTALEYARLFPGGENRRTALLERYSQTG
jgi:ankyrin repeat protein